MPSALVEVMNCPPDRIVMLKHRVGYSDLIQRYRSSDYRGLHLARQPTADAHLCQRCQTIDFDAIFETKTGAEGISVFDLGRVQRTAKRNCRFCHILVSELEAARHFYRPGFTWQLKLFPADWLGGRGYKRSQSTTNTILGAFPFDFQSKIIPLTMDRWILPMRQGFQTVPDGRCHGRHLPRKSVDYDYLRERLEDCLCAHSISKEVTNPMSGKLVVIDCASRSLVQLPPESNYICLSYVWGNDHKPSPEESATLTSSRKLPENLPQTIRDAMIVVTSLNQRYLWVDRYCIDQYHSASKILHVARMSEIFGESLVTLVALGKSSNCGLPGVSGISRNEQYRFVAGRAEYLYSAPPLEEFLYKSKWSTRGWTFQEASLSRRILYFTSSQVIFLCEFEQTREEITGTFAPEIRDHLVKFPLDSTRIAPSNKFLSVFGRDPYQFAAQLRQFQSRDLTYDSDALNAFRGILSIARYKTWWGVPMYHSRDECKTLGSAALSEQSIKNASSGFCHGLLWRSSEEWLALSSRTTRRSLFPSWSWASVKRPIYLHSDVPTDYFDGGDCDFQYYYHRSTGRGLLPTKKDPTHLEYDLPDVGFNAKLGVWLPNQQATMPMKDYCLRYQEKCLPELSHILLVETFVSHGPWRVEASVAEPETADRLRLRIPLECPSELLEEVDIAIRSPLASGFTIKLDPSHQIQFDSEAANDYTSIVNGEQILSAMLMLGIADTECVDWDGRFPFSSERGSVFFYWLAVIFKEGIARRVGVILSAVPYPFRLNKKNTGYGEYKLG